MKLNRQVALAVGVINRLSDDAKYAVVTSKTIAAELGTTEIYLSQILLKMKRAGILSVVRGPGGGYKLPVNPPLQNLNIYDIMIALGEKIKVKGVGNQYFSEEKAAEISDALTRTLQNIPVVSSINHNWTYLDNKGNESTIHGIKFALS
jgi:Rrf2 family protein